MLGGIGDWTNGSSPRPAVGRRSAGWATASAMPLDPPATSPPTPATTRPPTATAWGARWATGVSCSPTGIVYNNVNAAPVREPTAQTLRGAFTIWAAGVVVMNGSEHGATGEHRDKPDDDYDGTFTDSNSPANIVITAEGVAPYSASSTRPAQATLTASSTRPCARIEVLVSETSACRPSASLAASPAARKAPVSPSASRRPASLGGSRRRLDQVNPCPDSASRTVLVMRTLAHAFRRALEGGAVHVKNSSVVPQAPPGLRRGRPDADGGRFGSDAGGRSRRRSRPARGPEPHHLAERGAASSTPRARWGRRSQSVRRHRQQPGARRGRLQLQDVPGQEGPQGP